MKKTKSKVDRICSSKEGVYLFGEGYLAERKPKAETTLAVHLLRIKPGKKREKRAAIAHTEFQVAANQEHESKYLLLIREIR